MRGLIIVIFIFIFILIILINDKKYECYEDQYNTINNSLLQNTSNISINLNNIDKLKKDINLMMNMIIYIENNKNNNICDTECKQIFGISDNNINYYEMVKILFESYIDNFLDIYIVKRFNLKHFLTIKYQYPENNNEELDQLYYNLKKKINYINDNINDNPNFFTDIFLMTIPNLKNNLMILQDLYDDISSKSIFPFEDTKDIIRNINEKYLRLVLKHHDNKDFSIGLKFIEDLNDKNESIIYSYKNIKEENIIDIIENIEEMIANEINEIENFNMLSI